MSRTLTASDRKTLIRLASTMPKCSEKRRAILAGLKVAIEFSSKKELDAYLKKHPGADKSRHKVVDSGASPKERVDSFTKSVKSINWKDTDAAMDEVEQMVKGLDKFAESVLMGGDEVEDAVDEFKDQMDEVLASLEVGDGEYAKEEFDMAWKDFKDILGKHK